MYVESIVHKILFLCPLCPSAIFRTNDRGNALTLTSKHKLSMHMVHRLLQGVLLLSHDLLSPTFIHDRPECIERKDSVRGRSFLKNWLCGKDRDLSEIRYSHDIQCYRGILSMPKQQRRTQDWKVHDIQHNSDTLPMLKQERRNQGRNAGYHPGRTTASSSRPNRDQQPRHGALHAPGNNAYNHNGRTASQPQDTNVPHQTDNPRSDTGRQEQPQVQPGSDIGSSDATNGSGEQSADDEPTNRRQDDSQGPDADRSPSEH